MRRSSSILVLTIALSSIMFSLFQNCAPYSSSSVKTPLGSLGINPTPAPTSTPGQTPSIIFQPKSVVRGEQNAAVVIALTNVRQTYTLNWQITPAGTDFTPSSGSLIINSGATEATLRFNSTAAAGTGNKTFMLQVTEASSSKFTYSNQINVVDNTPPPMISAGMYSTCWVKNMVVQCWGDNSKGTLGTGDTTSHNVPVNVDVTGITAAFTQVSVGDYSTCGVAGGALFCWGDNPVGQLGDGTVAAKLKPVANATLRTGVQQVSVGSVHACAIVNGGVYCWGRNNHGQLGTGNTDNKLIPTAVPGLNSGVTAISAGYYFTCAIHNGAAKCWGWGANGQLGTGTGNNDAVSPQSVANAASGVTSIAAGGYHACAVIAGYIKCWGSNTFGELGDGTQISRNYPSALLNNPSGATQVTAGKNHTCGIFSGAALCWGFNTHYNVGDGTLTHRKSPGQVQTLISEVIGISAGQQSEHTCGIKNNEFVCWGLGTSGQRGRVYR